MRTAVPALTLIACSSGPNEETVVDGLTVVAITPDPPEASPGETRSLAWTLADPKGEATRFLAWTCTATVDGCLEGTQPPVEASPTGGQVVTTHLVPPTPAATETPAPLTVAWGLLVGETAEDFADDLIRDDTLRLDPTDRLARESFGNTALVAFPLQVSTRDPADRHRLPTVSLDAALLTAPPDAEADLTAVVDGAFGPEARVWVLTTQGAFTMPSQRVAPGDEVVFTWVAGSVPGQGTAWVVLVDDLGGQAVVAIDVATEG